MALFDLNEELIEYCTDCKRYHRFSLYQSASGHMILMDGDANYRVNQEHLDNLRDSQEEVRRAYLEEVALTGIDYLFLLDVQRSEVQDWLIGFEEDEQGVYFSRGKRVEWAGWLSALDPRIPPAVRLYATGHLGDDLHLRNIFHMEALAKIIHAAYGATWLGNGILRTTLTILHSAEEVQARVTEAARQALEEKAHG